MDVVDGILQSLRKALHAVRASLFLFDSPAEALQCLVSDADLEKVRIPVSRGIAGQAALEGAPVRVAACGPTDVEPSSSLEAALLQAERNSLARARGRTGG